MITRLFKFPSDNVFFVQIFRYAVSGFAACVIDYAVLALLVQACKLYYLTSAAIAFIVGLTVSYLLNVTWVFGRGSIASRRVEALLFFLLGIVGLALNHCCIQFFTERLRMHYMMSKTVSTVLVFIMNFVTRKYIVFRSDLKNALA